MKVEGSGTESSSRADALIDWFAREARDLPWRRERGVYTTVVSEFMLQQTQVKTVLPYYQTWMVAFPDFDALAAASEDEVLTRWAGLGYYSRARNLQRLARALVARDTWPTTASEWIQLPGVGPYTAAAVASLVHGDPAAVVDGNVVRVYTRYYGIERVFKSGSAAIDWIRPIANQRLDPSRPGIYNEALMELGATVCLPRKPRCLLCPWHHGCATGPGGRAETIPRIERTKSQTVEIRRVLWVQSGQVLLLRRAEKGRLEGFWEIPEIPEIPEREVRDWAGPVEVRKRGISHQRITEYLHRPTQGDLDRLREWMEKEPLKQAEWVSKEQLVTLPVSGPHRRWIAAAMESDGS